MHKSQKKAYAFQLENQVPSTVILCIQKFHNNKLQKLIEILFTGDCQAVYRL